MLVAYSRVLIFVLLVNRLDAKEIRKATANRNEDKNAKWRKARTIKSHSGAWRLHSSFTVGKTRMGVIFVSVAR